MSLMMCSQCGCGKNAHTSGVCAGCREANAAGMRADAIRSAAPTEDAPPPDVGCRHHPIRARCPTCGPADDLRAARARIAALEAETSEHVVVAADLRAKVAALEAENARLREELAALRQSLATSAARIATLTQERDEALGKMRSK